MFGGKHCGVYTELKIEKCQAILNRYRRQANGRDKKAMLGLGLGLMPGI